MSSLWLPLLCICTSFPGKEFLRLLWYRKHISLFIGTQSQFTTPDEICPGDDVTFTCIVTSGITRWSVSPGGNDGVCVYFSDSEVSETCGPGSSFSSSRTEGSDTPTNSSLSVVSIEPNLNGTVVECTDGNNISNVIGSDDICITGEFGATSILICFSAISLRKCPSPTLPGCHYY